MNVKRPELNPPQAPIATTAKVCNLHSLPYSPFFFQKKPEASRVKMGVPGAIVMATPTTTPVAPQQLGDMISFNSPPITTAHVRSPSPPINVASVAPAEKKEVVVPNADAWANLDDDEEDTGATKQSETVALWSEFKSKDEFMKQKVCDKVRIDSSI